MKLISRSLSACLIVAVSCLVWTGGISWGLVRVFHLPAATGWMIAGFLGFVATLAVTFILHGMKHAIFLSDHPDPELSTPSDLSANGRKSNPSRRS